MRTEYMLETSRLLCCLFCGMCWSCRHLTPPLTLGGRRPSRLPGPILPGVVPAGPDLTRRRASWARSYQASCQLGPILPGIVPAGPDLTRHRASWARSYQASCQQFLYHRLLHIQSYKSTVTVHICRSLCLYTLLGFQRKEFVKVCDIESNELCIHSSLLPTP